MEQNLSEREKFLDWRVMKVMKKVAVFLSLGLILVLAVFLGITFAAPSPWKLLGHQDYQVVGVADGSPILYNALLESDKKKINDHVTRLSETDPTAADQWISKIRATQMRPDIVPPVNFYTISVGNDLKKLDSSTFNISLGDEQELGTVKLARLQVGDDIVLAPVDPDYAPLPLGMVRSSDYKRYLIPTYKGLWLVESDKQTAVKISDDQYGGKTIDELEHELFLIGLEEDYSPNLWWNASPLFSPDGSKIVYITNRDCLEAGGFSIWLYHVTTGEEYPLVKNENGEYYVLEAWIDDNHLLVQKGIERTRDYYLLELSSGELTLLDLEGEYPDIIAVHPSGMIAYRPDLSTSKDLSIIKLDLNNRKMDKIYERQMEGVLRIGPTYYPFSPDGSKIGYINSVDDKGTQILVVIDLNQNKETVLRQAPSKEDILYDFDWIDNNRLLIRTLGKGDGDISSWVYELEGRG